MNIPIFKSAQGGSCDWWIVNDNGVKAGPLCENKAFMMHDAAGGDIILRAATKGAALLRYKQIEMGLVAASVKPTGWLKRALASRMGENQS